MQNLKVTPNVKKIEMKIYLFGIFGNLRRVSSCEAKTTTFLKLGITEKNILIII